MDDMDDFLGAEPEAEAVPAPEPEVTPEPKQERDEAGRFAKGEKEEGAPPAPEEKARTGQEAAIVAERRRRQEAEERAAQLQRQLEERQNPPAPPPSMWEDEQGWQQHFGSQVVSTAVQQATFNAKLDMSEMMARQAHPDFEDMKAEFITMMQENPALQQQALADPHPWNRAYQIAKNARTMKELGATDLESLKAQLREQIMAEQQAQAPAINLPKTLAGEQSVRGSVAANQGPPSLDSILKG